MSCQISEDDEEGEGVMMEEEEEEEDDDEVASRVKATVNEVLRVEVK